MERAKLLQLCKLNCLNWWLPARVKSSKFHIQWWITPIFTIAVVLVLVIHTAALTGVRTFALCTLHFALCILHLALCFWCWVIILLTNKPVIFGFSPFLLFPFGSFLSSVSLSCFFFCSLFSIFFLYFLFFVFQNSTPLLTES